MRSLIFIISIFFSTIVAAQDCDETSLLQKPGLWKTGNGSTNGIATSDLAKEKKIVDAIHAMIKSKYAPTGVEALFNGAYEASVTYMPVNSYRYNILALNYYCEKNVFKTAHETSTSFQIAANAFDAEIYDTAQGNRLLLEGFNVMYEMPVQKDERWCFKEKEVNIGFAMHGKQTGWLITYDGKLPYAYVTKKEFLEKRKKILVNVMADAAAGIKDVLKNKEIEKKYKEVEYKNDPDKLQRYMKMDYLSIKERYEKQLSEMEQNYQPAFDKIEVLLKMSPAELNQPAIIKQDPNDGLSYLFTDSDDPFCKILIKPNPAYFNKKLPRSSPQFFWVSVIHDDKNAIASKFMTDIMKAVDFTTLKSMLGK